MVYDNYSVVNIVNGDIFEIVDVVTPVWNSSELVVNFKGYVGNSSVNTGEDRGFRINSAKDLWPSYSLNKKGKKYQVVTKNKDAILGKLYVVVAEPLLDYIIVRKSGGSMACISNGGTLNHIGGATLELVDIIFNVGRRSGVDVSIIDSDGKRLELHIGKPVKVTAGEKMAKSHRILVSNHGKEIGSASINYLPEKAQGE